MAEEPHPFHIYTGTDRPHSPFEDAPTGAWLAFVR